MGNEVQKGQNNSTPTSGNKSQGNSPNTAHRSIKSTSDTSGHDFEGVDESGEEKSTIVSAATNEVNWKENPLHEAASKGTFRDVIDAITDKDINVINLGG